MKISIDTLFGRLAVLTIGLIVAVHVTSLMQIEREHFTYQARQTALIVALSAQTNAVKTDAGRAVASAFGLTFVPAKNAEVDSCTSPCTDTYGPVVADLRRILPKGSNVAVSMRSRTLWVRYPNATEWATFPGALPPISRFIEASSIMVVFAILLAIAGAWQIQRPLRRLALAARDFRIGCGPTVVKESGPQEIRELIGHFNDMVKNLAHAEQDRAIMLAGLAHDLRAPITRIQVRADLMHAEPMKSGFLGDAESLSRIVDQFLDYLPDRPDRSPLNSVDAYCCQHYGECFGDETPIKLDLQAGPEFKLPLTDLDRILSNLIENALSYGDPPIEISTRRTKGNYSLMVRDHGPGIPSAQVERAIEPFVRLDPARGGDAHCGLGLAIVKRLVRRHDGTFSLGNVAGGGLIATMRFPQAAK
ncbi:ATP-binding protein [Burkholderia ubonensis]|uniref:ATP-binding protein n=1 Tax=Burkholderia ubonensis TaxID=101571 RepID=UPI000BA680FD|nr:ATP-binding protein [Burkholderia ubonensis]PAJ86076.1 two-component sensor histidine kinase [Burkholderia ubonensis]PAJ93041.1 two-component sensor histidine kinase [Burkholderia ubonensis]PAK05593.1 two-component sensor histidine kinase [Burkholderia ubonensis]PAK11622.1 two-component sensor histidine kinase [Burkholderia ubonensis]RQP68224.1 HAMP domain-containing protein [Burkholderia ubonensis]